MNVFRRIRAWFTETADVAEASYKLRLLVDRERGERAKIVLHDADGNRYAIDATLLPQGRLTEGYPCVGIVGLDRRNPRDAA